MSKYTTEVRYICESKSGFSLEELPTKTVDQIINASWDKIFDFDFNFYSPEWNEKIAKFILKYYYTREIGLETVGLWKLKLAARCEEIANKYETMILAIESLEPEDILYNYKFEGQQERTDDLEETRTDDLTQTREDSLKTERAAESKDKFSDTPQNSLSSVENGTYLTSYRNIETSDEVNNTGRQIFSNTGDQTKTNTGTQTTTYGETGYKGSATLADYVSKLEFERFNVLGKIVYEFSDLFMLVW